MDWTRVFPSDLYPVVLYEICPEGKSGGGRNGHSELFPSRLYFLFLFSFPSKMTGYEQRWYESE